MFGINFDISNTTTRHHAHSFPIYHSRASDTCRWPKKIAQCQIFIAQTALVLHLLSEIHISCSCTRYELKNEVICHVLTYVSNVFNLKVIVFLGKQLKFLLAVLYLPLVSSPRVRSPKHPVASPCQSWRNRCNYCRTLRSDGRVLAGDCSWRLPPPRFPNFPPLRSRSTSSSFLCAGTETRRRRISNPGGSSRYRSWLFRQRSNCSRRRRLTIGNRRWRRPRSRLRTSLDVRSNCHRKCNNACCFTFGDCGDSRWEFTRWMFYQEELMLLDNSNRYLLVRYLIGVPTTRKAAHGVNTLSSESGTSCWFPSSLHMRCTRTSLPLMRFRSSGSPSHWNIRDWITKRYQNGLPHSQHSTLNVG